MSPTSQLLFPRYGGRKLSRDLDPQIQEVYIEGLMIRLISSRLCRGTACAFVKALLIQLYLYYKF